MIKRLNESVKYAYKTISNSKNVILHFYKILTDNLKHDTIRLFSTAEMPAAFDIVN